MPTINPYLKKRRHRKEYTVNEFVEGILEGNITILSQAVTLVESSLPIIRRWLRRSLKNVFRIRGIPCESG
jgi:putative protein kinase ArgK-like GTPase of G3E family